MRRGRRKEKPLPLDLFCVLPNIKLSHPQSRCTAGPVLPLSQKVFYPPSTGYEQQWQGTTQGSAPASFPTCPENGESPLLAVSLTGHSNVLGIEEQVEFDQMSSCPCMFSPSSASSARRGEERTKNTHIQMGKKIPTQLKEGQKINCHPFLKIQLA